MRVQSKKLFSCYCPCKRTCEADFEEILLVELSPVHGLHSWADSFVAGAEVLKQNRFFSPKTTLVQLLTLFRNFTNIFARIYASFLNDCSYFKLLLASTVSY
jgi:hypothetical protein